MTSTSEEDEAQEASSSNVQRLRQRSSQDLRLLEARKANELQLWEGGPSLFAVEDLIAARQQWLQGGVLRSTPPSIQGRCRKHL